VDESSCRQEIGLTKRSAAPPFQTQILAFLAKLGLLGDMNVLTATSDGTPIVTSAKSTCNFRARDLADCNHPRIYSQPDCDLGWEA